ncbi:MAG TPA: Crp/Fnr family transcriptional regulator [Terriglobales bacterium]|nr:Crp/Fnr family transcriptional regulator [Terriglobales bacterium]
MSQSAKDRLTVLRKIALFADLAEDELAYIVDRVVSRKFRSGEPIFSEGDPCPGLWVVESGKVKIFKAAASGREQVLTFEGPGSSIAELPVFDGGPYPASAAAVADSTLLFVSKEDFRRLCLKSPEVALKVLRVVGGRLRGLVVIIEELSFSTVRHRLASFLLRLARQGVRVPQGVEIALPVNQQEVAAQIGTVRELVSRGLGRLQAQGTIEIEGRRILIRDLKALQRELEDSD